MSKIINFNTAQKDQTIRRLNELRNSITNRLKEVSVTCTPIPKGYFPRGAKIAENLGPIVVDTIVKFNLKKITNEDQIYAFHEATVAIVEMARPSGANAVMQIEPEITDICEDQDYNYIHLTTKGIAVRLTPKIK